MGQNVVEKKSLSNKLPIEYSYGGNVNEMELIAALKDDIMQRINQSTCDLKLLNELNTIVEEFGHVACQIIFQVMADLHLNRDDTLEYWINVHQYGLWLNEQVGHPLPLVATMCDYFSQTKHKLIINPKLTTYQHFDTLVNHSTIDRLTGLFNRNCLNDTLNHLLALTQREGTELTFALLDLDDFKLVNDNYGHQMGDVVLRQFGKLLSSSIRQSDIALRYGGEEFIILMPNTNFKDALILINRIRLKVTSTLFSKDGINLKVSISGGLAVYPTHAKTANELIYSADRALYSAKGAGKNNIKVFKNENRQFLRVPLLTKIKVKAINFDGATIEEGDCQNIGLGGVLFETTQLYFFGDAIQLNIEEEAGDFIVILGLVVRVESLADDRFAIAVSFPCDDMEKLAKTKIAGIIEQHEKRTT
jgi:diguanylate cyclase (GGDEF)-like protein